MAERFYVKFGDRRFLRYRAVNIQTHGHTETTPRAVVGMVTTTLNKQTTELHQCIHYEQARSLEFYKEKEREMWRHDTEVWPRKEKFDIVTIYRDAVTVFHPPTSRIVRRLVVHRRGCLTVCSIING